ncbi:MAG: 50S ribosomal protein L11 methyltransferase [Breznakibacter sp.]
MPYTKVGVELHPYHGDAADVMIAIMGELGFESFEENETGFDAYVPTADFDFGAVKQIDLPFDDISFSLSVEEIPDQNWNEVWEKNYFQPIVIGNQCVVRGPFHPQFPEIPYQIVIEPKMAFGTGHHETTGMMLQHILEHDFNGLDVLDMGCGTGILGILASMRGARKVLGIDIDKWCTDNTEENCHLNRIGNMEVVLGGAEKLPQAGTFDVVLANINRNILLADMQYYASSLKNNGLLLLSGFYVSDLDAINAGTDKSGMAFLGYKEQNQWVAAAYKKTV